jgi:dTDP-4-dehydrorhamnose reductase
MPHTLILGGRGQLGRDLERLFTDEGEVTSVDLPEVDIGAEGTLSDLANDIRPDVLLNAAAYTDVEKAENDEAAAFRANETGARYAAQAAKAVDAPIVYYSTDYVFGGVQTRPYVETDDAAPMGVYARSKLAGERATMEENPRHLILRTAWLYGPGGNNFVEKIIHLAQTHPEIKVVDDEIGAPAYTGDLAEATLALLKIGACGIYHVTNAGRCTRYEFAQEILRLAGLDTPITPCASSEFPTKAERPLYSVLATGKLQQTTGYVPRHWKDALADYFMRRDTD